MWSRLTKLSRYTFSDAASAIYVSRAEERNVRPQSHYLCSYYAPGHVEWGRFMYSRICASLFGPPYTLRRTSEICQETEQLETRHMESTKLRIQGTYLQSPRREEFQLAGRAFRGPGESFAYASHTVRAVNVSRVLRVLKCLQSVT